MSYKGKDESGCGESEETPCSSLNYVINISQSGDEILLTSSQSEDRIFEFCSSQPIAKDLSFAGNFAGRKNFIAVSCKNRSEEAAPLLFHFQNSSICLQNLTVKNSHILASNIVMNITNCQFVNSALLLMEPLYYGHYLHQAKDKLYMDLITDMYTRYVSRQPDSDPDFWDVYPILLCVNISVYMNNVKWQPLSIESPLYIDLYHPIGIQAASQEIHLIMEWSNMSDNPIHLHALTNLTLHFQNSIFQGSASGSVTQGGLKIETYCFPKVVLEKCLFDNLKFFDIAFTQIASLKQIQAAMGLRVHHIENQQYMKHFSVERVKLYEHHIYVLDCVFSNNLRALAVASLSKLSQVVTVLVNDTKFHQNQIVSDGAAIWIKGKYISTDVRNTIFTENQAGVHPFNIGLTVPGYPVGEDLPAAFGFEMIGEDTMKLDLVSNLNSPDLTMQNKTMLIKLRGSGGAISVRFANRFVLQDCSFSNNTANNYGGAIYAGRSAYFGITRTSLVSGYVPKNFMSGILFQSYSNTVYLQDVHFKLSRPTNKNISILYHSKDTVKYSISMLNITIECPLNTRLVAQNTSIDMESQAQFLGYTFKLLKLNDLIYSCEQCSHGSYALEAGFFQHTSQLTDIFIPPRRIKRSLETDIFLSNNASSSVSEDIHTAVPPSAPPPAPPVLLPPPPPPPPFFSIPPPPVLGVDTIHHLYSPQVTCNICPFGGICHDGIAAKTNYWGLQNEGLVTFYKCPPGYCCASKTCEPYNDCQKNRVGVLCSQCAAGYSEALFSPSCLPDDQCTHYWFFFVTILLVCLYAMFLLFQVNLKDFVLGAPIGRDTLQRKITAAWTVKRKVNMKHTLAIGTKQISLEQNTSKSEEIETRKDEGGIFLILLFYYFQDAAIVHFHPVYAEAADPIVALIKRFVGGLFKFQLDLMIFAGNICPFPGLTPVMKVWLKLLFIPSLFIILVTIFVVSKAKMSKAGSRKWQILCGKASTAIMLAILFSYQKLASSAFSLVYCVPVSDHNVLFLDGSIQCLQFWQVVVFIYIYLCIVPFGFYITVAPSMLQSGQLSLFQYFLGCFFPAPVMLFHLFMTLGMRDNDDKMKQRVDEDKAFDEASLVYVLLQGPYREYRIQLPFIRDIPLCWSGMLLIRRLSLIITHIYVHNILLSLILMTFISLAALLHHLTVQPCKEKRANMAGTISSTALLTVAIINLIRAAFEAGELIPENGLRSIMDALQLVEDCLLFWIPLVGACVMILFLICRFGNAVIGKMCKTS